MILEQIHDNLSPSAFERLIYALLDKKGFSEIELTAQSGDGGIDLVGTSTQTQVPGLEIDLNYKIQVKRTSPRTSLNPIYLRALKASMRRRNTT